MATGLADKPAAAAKPSGTADAAVLELKGGMYAFMSLRLRSDDIARIDAALADKVQQAPGFFRDTPVVVDLIDLDADEDRPVALDTAALLEVIRRHHLKPIVASVQDRESELARAIDLPLVEGSARRRVKKSGSADRVDDGVDAGSSAAANDDKPSLIAGKPRPRATDEAMARADDHDDTLELAQPSEVQYVVKTPMLINRPVRSGQQIYARDTDLIIMGQVGPGAEIIADNNIHVYGALRGRALCGVSGNTQSRIFCQALEAELVSVAGNYRLLESVPEQLRGKPAQIWLDNERLNIEPL